MDLWPSHILGLDNAAGHWYLFHSGIEGQLDRAAVVLILWRHVNCHEEGCWLIGIHRDGDGHVTCRRHKPKRPVVPRARIRGKRCG